LIRMHTCLERLRNRPELTLSLDPYDCLSCRQIKEPVDDADNQWNLVYLYMSINSAIRRGNYYFCNRNGGLVLLEELDELIKTIYPKTDNMIELVRDEVLDQLQRIPMEQKLLIEKFKKYPCSKLPDSMYELELLETKVPEVDEKQLNNLMLKAKKKQLLGL